MKKMMLFFAMIAFSFVASSFDGPSPVWGQCGGMGYTGPTSCVAGSSCVFMNDSYSQCLPSSQTPEPCRTSSTDCQSGGCGSTQCSIKSPDLPVGGGAEKSVTAATGYYACCWKEDWTGNTYARTYPNSCCN